ncbi:MAG: metal-dependent hydrolase [Lactobacillales bacterium]|jgi:L-ascorbate metabolism protein UlaG (beta-lactamase superfamily)|nr:metal-dependent hydrolase [Lactobacillales bacterium]
MTDILDYKDVHIRYLSHSAFVISYQDYKIVMDPFLTGNRNAKAKVSDIAATHIFVTHGHRDHVGDSAQIAMQNDCTIWAPFDTAKYLEAKGAKTEGVSVGGTLKYPWGRAHFRFAMHTGFHEDGSSFGQASSILLTLSNGVKIYHMGDTALQLDFKLVQEIYAPQIVFMPIGGKFTMDIDEAVHAVKFLKPEIVIPIHYNTFDFIKADPMEFKTKVESQTQTKCLVLCVPQE